MKIFTLLLMMVTIFIGNIGLYYMSENYRSFLQNIKNEDKDAVKSDEYSIEPDEIKKILQEESNEKLSEQLEKEIPIISNLEKQKEVEIDNPNGEIVSIKVSDTKVEQLTMSAYEKEMLFLFGRYNFTKLTSHGSLMDLTSEYPDKYFEYYLPDLTLIFFSTKNYNQVKEIFYVEQDNGNYKINEVDNFGDESFYVNMKPGFEDGNIRIVFTKNGKVFGLKISKNEYNNVKNILKGL